MKNNRSQLLGNHCVIYHIPQYFLRAHAVILGEHGLYMQEKGQLSATQAVCIKLFSSQKGEVAKINFLLPSTDNKFPSLYVQPASQWSDAELVFLNMHNEIAGEFCSGWTWFLEKSFAKYSHLYQNLNQKQKRTSELNHLYLGQGLIQYLLILLISFSLSLCNIYRSVLKTTKLR